MEEIAGKTVLVVDDDPKIRTMLTQYLTAARYKVVEAKGASEAMKILLQQKVDLVLLDTTMGQIGGETVLEKAKENEKTAGIPIIMCTGRGSREDVMLAIKPGAKDYSLKPVAPAIVIEKVKRLIGEPPLPPKKPKPPKPAPPAPKGKEDEHAQAPPKAKEGETAPAPSKPKEGEAAPAPPKPKQGEPPTPAPPKE